MNTGVKEKKQEQECGMISVEFTIIMVMFMVFIMLMMQIIDVIRTQVIIQSAITETAKEISSYSYVLSKAGYFDLRDDISKSAEANNNLTEIKEGYVGLMSAINTGNQPDESDFDKIVTAMQEFTVKDITSPLAEAGAEAGSNKLTQVVTEQLIKKYLQDQNGSVDYLKSMGIKDGFEGLDFSYSEFAQGTDEPIRITVVYRIKIVDVPFFENFSFDKKIVLNATTRIWGN